MRKPGAAWREEPWWHWDWPGRPQGFVTQANGVQNLRGGDEITQKPVADLYVPDPESHSGWRQYYVYNEPPAPPKQRKLGL